MIARVHPACPDHAQSQARITVGVSETIIDASFQALMDSIVYELIKAEAPAT